MVGRRETAGRWLWCERVHRRCSAWQVQVRVGAKWPTVRREQGTAWFWMGGQYLKTSADPRSSSSRPFIDLALSLTGLMLRE